MKVLRQVCRHCGYVSFYSVEVICLPRTATNLGLTCPSCGEDQAPVFTATEIDMEEVNAEPVDVDAIRRSIQNAT
jgi:hypothetical protein